MATNLSPAWMNQFALDILSPAPMGSPSDPIKYEAKTVLVANTDDDLRTLTLTDNRHSIVGMLTEECYADLLSRDGGSTGLERYRYALITLPRSSYHLTTVMQCLGGRDTNKLEFLLKPFALQVSSVSVVEISVNVNQHYGHRVIEINKCPQILTKVKEVCGVDSPYRHLVQLLGARQFPTNNGQLPDAEGQFELPPPPDVITNPLLPIQTMMTKFQDQQFHLLPSFDVNRMMNLDEKDSDDVFEKEQGSLSPITQTAQTTQDVVDRIYGTLRTLRKELDPDHQIGRECGLDYFPERVSSRNVGKAPFPGFPTEEAVVEDAKAVVENSQEECLQEKPSKRGHDASSSHLGNLENDSTLDSTWLDKNNSSSVSASVPVTPKKQKLVGSIGITGSYKKGDAAAAAVPDHTEYERRDQDQKLSALATYNLRQELAAFRKRKWGREARQYLPNDTVTALHTRIPQSPEELIMIISEENLLEWGDELLAVLYDSIRDSSSLALFPNFVKPDTSLFDDSSETAMDIARGEDGAIPNLTSSSSSSLGLCLSPVVGKQQFSSEKKGGSTTKTVPKKRADGPIKRVKWTTGEEQALREGVNKHGRQWSKILQEQRAKFHPKRDSNGLKDKARNMGL